jgi:hypothetical protein
LNHLIKPKLKSRQENRHPMRTITPFDESSIDTPLNPPFLKGLFTNKGTEASLL